MQPRLNNDDGQPVTANYVIKDQSQNHSYNLSGAVTKNMTHGFSFKGGFNYGVSKSLVEPSSTAGSSWAGTFQGIVNDPNNPQLAYSQNSPGKRVFFAANYTKQYFSWGATTFSVFYDGHTNGSPTSYIFASDANGDRPDQRPDLHPEGHLGDELQAADGERRRPTPPPIRPPRSNS